jgi:PAS domain S-box-containing protein
MDDQNAKKVFRIYNEVYRTGESTKAFAWEIIRKDGTRRFVEASVSRRKDATGEPIGFRGIVRDITERKQAEEARDAIEAKYRQLVQQAVDGIFIADRSGNLVLVNQKSCEMLGYPEEELLRINIADTYPVEDKNLALKRMSGMTAGKAMQFERRMRRKDGSLFPVEVSLGKLDDGGFQGIVRDVTERKQKEAELRLLAQTVSSAQDCVSITDMEDKVIFVNEAFLRTYGYSEEELLGKNIAMVRSPLTSPKVGAQILPGTLAGGWNGELFNRRKDGTDFPIELWTSVVHDEQGKPVGLLGVARDITQRKQAAEQLEQSVSMLRATLESTADGILVVDAHGRIQSFNQKFVDLWRIPEAILATLDDNHALEFVLTQLKEPEAFLQKVRALYSQKDGESYDTLEFKDGRVFERYSKAQQIGNETVGRVWSFRDITDRKKMEEEKKTLQQQLFQAQKMESIGTLAGGIAHDFNNILGIILGHASFIQPGEADAETLTMSGGAITRAVQRGANLVKQILTFARKTETAREPVNANTMIEELAKMLRETFPKTTEIALHLDKKIPLVTMDHSQLHQALLNLCVNARDAMNDPTNTSRQGGTLTIGTEILHTAAMRDRFPDATESSYLCISVSDTGVGMDEATKQRIFEPFFTTKEPGRGTGLGLAVVYGVAKSHQGFVDVESEIGRGTMFRLYIPIPETVGALTVTEVKTSKHITGGTETILFVEDEEVLRTLMKTQLENKGYRVLTAQDGKEAIQMYTQHEQDIALVLTDIGLPRLSGQEVVATISALNPHARIIVASGFLDPDVRAVLSKAGAKDFAQKPYVPGEILAKVREVLDRACTP